MRCLGPACLMCAALLSPLPAAAQQAPPDPPSRFELSILLGVNGPLMDGTLTTLYEPPFLFADATGTAGQTLALSADPGIGLGASIAYLAGERFGVQGLFNAFGSGLAGDNTPYEISVTYTSMPPPFFTPQQNVYRRSIAWPATTGSLRNLSASANALVRFGGGRVSAAASGGLSVFRVDGNAESLGYTSFRLGGHSVLFLDQYRLAFDIDPVTAIGFNLGGELDVALSDRLAVVVDGRYFYAPGEQADVTLTEIVNLDEVINVESIGTIQQQMDLQPLEVDASFFRLAFGLKVRF